ncbi:MAG: hypothetical protein AAF401_15255 [Pseudomonadota bacterium]
MRSVIALAIAITALGVIGPMLAPYDPNAINIPKRLSAPGGEFLLGSDALGRDILSHSGHRVRASAR